MFFSAILAPALYLLLGSYVLTARCLGACSLAPAVVIDDNVHGKLDRSA